MDLAALLLTCQLMIGSVAIAVLIGCSAAVAVTVAAGPGRATGLFWLAMVAACALPLYLHAAAWEAAAGKFGVLRWTQSAAATQPLSGLSAAVCIHGISGAAWVALATGFGLSRLPRSLTELASLDAGLIRRWWSILLPACGPWIAAGALWVATLAATEMTVVDLYGVRTLADEFYLYYAAQPTTAAVLRSVIPSLPIGIALAIALRRSLLGPAAGQGGMEKEMGVAPPGAGIFSRRWMVHGVSSDASAAARGCAVIWGGAVVLVMLAVPLASLLINAGQSVTVLTSGEESFVVRSWSAAVAADSVVNAFWVFAAEYQWTLLIGLLMGLIATAAASGLVLGLRLRAGGRAWLDCIVLAAVMVPGPIVALAVVWLFRRDLPGLDLLYHQTLLPTCLALMPRSGAAAYVTLRVATARLDRSVSEAARLDCPSRWRRFWVIQRPRLASALLASATIAALVAVADVPATLPVIPPGVSTVGVRLFGLLHSGARQQEAALAIGLVLILAGGTGMLAAGWRFLTFRRCRTGDRTLT